jgi:hypothetical protein
MKLITNLNSMLGHRIGSNGLNYIIQILLIVCLLVTPVHMVWNWPLFAHKFQPPEFIFLLLFALAIVYIRRNYHKLWFGPIDVGVLVWLGVNILSGVQAGLNFRISLELLGVLYLTLLYFTIRMTIGKHLLKNFANYITITAVIAASLGIIGWCLNAAGFFTMLVDGMDVYPILGDIGGRAKAFTAGSNMLAHILMVSILIKVADAWHNNEFSRRDFVVIGIMLIGFVLTFSKIVLILPIGLILVWYLSSKRNRNLFLRTLIWAVSLLLIILFILITVLHPIHKNDQNIEKMAVRFYSSEKPVFTAGSFNFLLTSYAIGFQIGLLAFEKSFPWGVGPGEYQLFAYQAQKDGLKYKSNIYPREVKPHSTYIGAIAELGVLGAFSILFLWYLIGRGCYEALQVKEYRGLAVGLSASFVTTAIHAYCIDIMNFRHLWWLFAITAVLCQHAQNKHPI